MFTRVHINLERLKGKWQKQALEKQCTQQQRENMFETMYHGKKKDRVNKQRKYDVQKKQNNNNIKYKNNDLRRKKSARHFFSTQK